MAKSKRSIVQMKNQVVMKETERLKIGRFFSNARGLSVSDKDGHYDLDGVSFESGVVVVVASDSKLERRT